MIMIVIAMNDFFTRHIAYITFGILYQRPVESSLASFLAVDIVSSPKLTKVEKLMKR